MEHHDDMTRRFTELRAAVTAVRADYRRYVQKRDDAARERIDAWLSGPDALLLKAVKGMVGREPGWWKKDLPPRWW